ncbi:sulfatase-like hydrolase/transferase [Pedobacter sp. HMF7647]|uniref:Sulfatase-like hydrolase/transferase n=1 Tax=Hufsiella arboris TaxID=2695275 RepID=A0A7K1YC99_9SPHI|nr:alkaline phosphatase family protein [Hufsiella arboris]MXV52214.1 sulfatase-like hydrolase/transferase [Hufsiella arboris]
MLKSLFVLIRFFLFWLAFFCIDRLIFILYFREKVSVESLPEILKAFLYGLWMDASMVGYISSLPLLLYLFTWIVPDVNVSPKVFRAFTKILIVLFSFITIVNLNIYREWGTKINFRALDFAVNSPNEAIASSASSPIISSFLVFFLLIAAGFLLQKVIISYKLPPRISFVKGVLSGLLFIGLTFLAIRGGTDVAPMNESMAYYSSNTFLNHAAINTEWTFMKDILSNKYGNKNPYNYLQPAMADQLIRNTYTMPPGSPPKILTTERPNIVFIVMESFTAGVVNSLDGDQNISPEFEKLTKKGVYFKNIYAAGDRTDKGLVAVLSAFPSQAIRSVIHQNSKQEKLPAISKMLLENGYHTSFFYGGESQFFNFKSYILSHGFQQLVDKNHFSAKDMNSKWGAFDHVVYNRQLADLGNDPKQPFFSTLLTLTNHEPFELPGKSKFKGTTNEDKFMSTSFYSDSCLGDYFRKAEQKPWYKNTVFVIVADHGHRLPQSRYDIDDPHRFHIPLLILGGAVKPEYQGTEIMKVGSQVDIAATLLNQLNLSAKTFNWSKDLLNPQTPEFAFYNWDNGFGFATATQTISFDNVGKRVSFVKNRQISPTIDDQIVQTGKAFMQKVFQEYLDY